MEKERGEENDFQDKNDRALEKIAIAKPILDKIKVNPKLANFHDPILSKIGDSRWNGQFVSETLSEIMRIYQTLNYDEVVGKEKVNLKVQNFIREAYDYEFRRF